MTSQMSDQAQRANLASSWGSLRRHNVWSITCRPTLTGMLSLIRRSWASMGHPSSIDSLFAGKSRSQYGALDPRTFSFRLTNGGRR